LGKQREEDSKTTLLGGYVGNGGEGSGFESAREV